MNSGKEYCLDEFLKNQNPTTAYNFVLSCQDYVLNICKRWYEPNLSEKDKVRELICEIFLILLEKFDPSKVQRRASLLSYIHHRLKQVVYVRGRSSFGVNETELAGDNHGRYNFTWEKVAITNAVHSCVRKALLDEQDEDCAFLVFLFVHVFPQTFWASRQLIGADSNSVTLLERYRKKIQRFNMRLRRSIELQLEFDWKDVFTWTRGERSHLAWKIICISPTEVEDSCHAELEMVGRWRERAKRDELGSHQDKQAALRVLNSMRTVGQASAFDSAFAAEDVACWGTPRDMLDIFLGVESERLDNLVLAEKKADSLHRVGLSDKEFTDMVGEMMGWFSDLSKAKVSK